MGQVAAWYAGEASVRDCALRAGIPEQTMWRYMRAADIKMRPPGGGRQRPGPPRRRLREQSRAAGELVLKHHEAGLRGSQIDRVFGWRAGRAAKIQRRLGLDPARPGSQPDPVVLAGKLGPHLRAIRVARSVQPRVPLAELAYRYGVTFQAMEVFAAAQGLASVSG